MTHWVCHLERIIDLVCLLAELAAFNLEGQTSNSWPSEEECMELVSRLAEITPLPADLRPAALTAFEQKYDSLALPAMFCVLAARQKGDPVRTATIAVSTILLGNVAAPGAGICIHDVKKTSYHAHNLCGHSSTVS